MAKSAFPMKTGSGLLAKSIGVLVVLAALAMVIKEPASAASFVTGVFHLAGGAIDGISSFLSQVAR